MFHMIKTKNTTNVSEFHLKDKAGKKVIQSDILPVDEDLAWHYSSAATALWSGGFDVQLFEEVYVETKNITSRVIRITYGTVNDVVNASYLINAPSTADSSTVVSFVS